MTKLYIAGTRYSRSHCRATHNPDFYSFVAGFGQKGGYCLVLLNMSVVAICSPPYAPIPLLRESCLTCHAEI